MPLPRDHHLWLTRNCQKLGDIVAASSTPPPWQEAWLGLRPNVTDEERLAVYQAVRKADSVPTAVSFFLIAWLLDGLMTDRRAEPGLRELEARLAAIHYQHGLEEEVSADSDEVITANTSWPACSALTGKSLFSSSRPGDASSIRMTRTKRRGPTGLTCCSTW